MNTNSKPTNNACLNICLALPAEAKPLIQHFNLSRHHPHSRQAMFAGDQIRLIITGPGDRNMAAGIGFLDALGIEPHHGFLNLGIAGGNLSQHQQAFVIKKISHNLLTRCYYPSLLPSKLPYTSLSSTTTNDSPYSAEHLIDQEGHAFFECATRHVSQEQVALLKIVSDHDDHSRQNISSKVTQDLIKNHMADIEDIMSQLLKRSKQESMIHPVVDIEAYCQHWHFTHSEKNQLREYLRRAHIHQLDIRCDQLQRLKTAKHVLIHLQQALQQHPYHW